MIDEIKKLKDIKEKSLDEILKFLSTGDTTNVNPLIYTNLYEFAEKNISSMSNKPKSNPFNGPYYKKHDV